MAVLPYTGEQWRRFLMEVGRADLVARSWFDLRGQSRLASNRHRYRAVRIATKRPSNRGGRMSQLSVVVRRSPRRARLLASALLAVLAACVKPGRSLIVLHK